MGVKVAASAAGGVLHMLHIFFIIIVFCMPQYNAVLHDPAKMH